MTVVMALIMMMPVAVGMVMTGIMMMPVAVGMVMAMIMFMNMAMLMLMLRFGFSRATDFYWIASISASTGITHNCKFYSTSNDFICNSAPRISLLPAFWHSGHWLNAPSGV